MTNRSILILAVAVLAVCIGAIWFLQIKPDPATPTPARQDAPPPQPTEWTSMGAPPRPVTESRPPERPQPERMTQKPAEAPTPLAQWEVKIDQALRADIGETETAQLLINMIPTLPADGQAEAAQHVSNLLLDKDYNRVVPLVKNPNLPEEVLDVFMTDLMNREDAVKLPVLLDIAKIPNHPHREEAQSDLEIFLDEDYGNDWAKWDAALKLYLAKEAEDEAAAAAAGGAGPGTPQAPAARR